MGGSKGGGTTTSTTTNEPPAYAKPNLEFAAAESRRFYDDPQYQQGWEGQTFVDYSPQSLEALQGMEARARAGSDLTRQAQATNLATMQGDYLNPETNPYLKGNIDFANQAIADQYRTAVAPQISGSFAKSGRYGSGFQQGAMSDANANLLKQLSGNAVGMSDANFQRERQNQLAATQLAPTLANQDYTDLQQLGDVGSAYEDKTAAALQDEINRFYQQQYAGPNALNQFIAQTMGTAGNYGTQTQVTQAPKQKSNFFGTALGIGSLLAAPFTGGATLPFGIGGMGGGIGGTGGLFDLGYGSRGAGLGTAMPWLTSDEQLKENIKPLGKENGHNIYEFNYKGEPQKYIGVLAQEVRLTHPEAVKAHESGYLMVNYDAIGVRMRAV